MKRILITGVNSYIGLSFEKYIMQFGDEYQVDTIDMIDGSWREKSFSDYDVVFHVAGIAHIKETEENAHLYYEVNRDLPIGVADKAKKEGVKQFIFMSSMSVYGRDTGIITKATLLTPKSNYGKSKLEAEKGLSNLENDSFHICILRPPMIYGDGCKGNYQTLSKLIQTISIFPNVSNKRSMISIERLCNYIVMLIESQSKGLFFPQDNEYMTTKRLAKIIADSTGKKIHYSYFLGFAVIVCRPFSRTLSKAFGNLTYEGME